MTSMVEILRTTAPQPPPSMSDMFLKYASQGINQVLPYEMYLLPRLNRNKKDTPVNIVFTFSFICKFSTPIPFPH